MTEPMPDTQPKRTLGGRVRDLVSDIRGRSLLVRLAIAAGLVFVFVLVPAFIATRPDFTQRYANLQAEHDTWETSVHAQVVCQRCHVPPDLVSRARYGIRMTGEFYLQLLPIAREPDIMAIPGDAACESCHIDLRAVSPSGDLNIPHRAHVEVLEMACVDCHSYLVHETNPQGNQAPTMAGCLECHDGVKAKGDCEACHNEKAAPDSHKAAEWTIVHSERQEDEDCVSCHGWTENWCSQCHTLRPGSHTIDWRATHRTAVEIRRNCETCHEGVFCEECHGELPQLNYDPTVILVE
ncbi:MAG: cytochrome c3 family protein [Anaerosomatales bacterium]|nr:cytochrome c3 family protein [Anaerosomatales bacterium]